MIPKTIWNLRQCLALLKQLLVYNPILVQYSTFQNLNLKVSFSGTHRETLSLQPRTNKKTDRIGRNLEGLQIKATYTTSSSRILLFIIIIIIFMLKVNKTIVEQLSTQCKTGIFSNILQYFTIVLHIPNDVSKFIGIFFKSFLSRVQQRFFKPNPSTTTTTSTTATATNAPNKWKHCVRKSH